MGTPQWRDKKKKATLTAKLKKVTKNTTANSTTWMLKNASLCAPSSPMRDVFKNDSAKSSHLPLLPRPRVTVTRKQTPGDGAGREGRVKQHFVKPK